MSSYSSSSVAASKQKPRDQDLSSIEPDDEWKRQLKQKIEKTLLSMREEAEAQKEHDLAERPEDRAIIEEEFRSLMRTIEGIATEQYNEELARYREERAWTMGINMGAGWQEKVVKEQQAILDRIKSESGGTLKEETVPTSAPSRTAPNVEELEEDYEDKPLPAASKGKKPARSYSLREAPDSPSRPSVNSPPKPPPEIWRPPPESMVEPPTVPQRRGSTASVRSTGSGSYRSTPVPTTATPVADPIPEAQDEVARKSEEEQRRINAAEQQWKALDATRERGKLQQQQKPSSPSTNREPKVEDKRKDIEDEVAAAPSTSPSQSRRPPTPPLNTKPVHRQPSQHSFITETRSHDSPRYYSPSAGPSLLSTSRPPENSPVASSPESYRSAYASPAYHPHMSATLTYAASSPYTHSTAPSPLHHPEYVPVDPHHMRHRPSQDSFHHPSSASIPIRYNHNPNQYSSNYFPPPAPEADYYSSYQYRHRPPGPEMVYAPPPPPPPPPPLPPQPPQPEAWRSWGASTSPYYPIARRRQEDAANDDETDEDDEYDEESDYPPARRRRYARRRRTPSPKPPPLAAIEDVVGIERARSTRKTEKRRGVDSSSSSYGRVSGSMEAKQEAERVRQAAAEEERRNRQMEEERFKRQQVEEERRRRQQMEEERRRREEEEERLRREEEEEAERAREEAERQAEEARLEDLRRREEEIRRREEAERARQEEEKRERRAKQREEEARKKEEKARRLAEEAKRKEAEARKKEAEAKRREKEIRMREEELRRREEELIRREREEEERREKEELAKRLEEEARQREEVARKREEELKKREEEARRREETLREREEMRRREEETRKREAEAKRREEELRRREEEAKRREEEELRRRQEAEERRLREEDERRFREEEERRLREEEERRFREEAEAEKRRQEEEEVRRKEEEKQQAEARRLEASRRRREQRDKEEARKREEEQIRLDGEEARRLQEQLAREDKEQMWRNYDRRKEESEAVRMQEEWKRLGEEKKRREEEKLREEQRRKEHAQAESNKKREEEGRRVRQDSLSDGWQSWSSSASASASPWANAKRSSAQAASGTSTPNRSSSASTNSAWSTSTKATSASTHATPNAGRTSSASSTTSTPTPKPRSGSTSTSSTPGYSIPNISEAEWHRRQEAHAREQQEKFRVEQERLERERQARAAKVMNKEDLVVLFDHHERVWAQLQTLDELRWDIFPWPMLKKPSSPEDITSTAISAYILSPHYPDKDKKSEKDRIKEHIRRWHPDRFETKLLLKVIPSEKEKVKEGAGSVVRSLNDLLTKSSIPRFFD